MTQALEPGIRENHNPFWVDQVWWSYQWTADKTFLGDMWPIVQRACDWQCRVCDPDNDGLFQEHYGFWTGDNGGEGPKAGKNAPYAEFKAESLMVEDEDAALGYSRATNDDVYDPEIEKFYIDPWGHPYVYRENASKKRRDWMIKPKSFDVWSIGPNEINEACYGQDETGDDVGNW